MIALIYGIVDYKIISFDEQRAQIIVDFEGVCAIAIDLPIDENRKVPVGSDLEAYINKVAPVDLISRNKNIKNGVTNAQDIRSLCEDYNKKEILVEDLNVTVRSDRLMRLLKSDWTQLPDAQLTALELEAWNEYRQALRDIPQQSEFPGTVVYPLAPDEEAR